MPRDLSGVSSVLPLLSVELTVMTTGGNCSRRYEGQSRETEASPAADLESV